MDMAGEGGGPHRLTLEDRQHLVLTGVTDVDSFDDNSVLLRTNLDAGSYKQYIFPLLFFNCRRLFVCAAAHSRTRPETPAPAG